MALGPTRCQEIFIKDLNKFIITVLQVELEDSVEAVKKLLKSSCVIVLKLPISNYTTLTKN